MYIRYQNSTISILLNGTKGGACYTQVLNRELDDTIIYTMKIVVMIERFFVQMTVLWVEKTDYYRPLHPSVLGES